MANIQKEEEFKKVLEKFFECGESYSNIIRFLEDNGFDYNVTDFTEELMKYDKSIYRTFDTNFLQVDTASLNYKLSTLMFNNVYSALDAIKHLNPDEFERLCALYLKHLGSTTYNITKTSHDQGIDFVGAIDNEKDLKIFSNLNSATKIYAIGQAKHYREEQVGSKEIRELAGSLYLLKHRVSALLKAPYKTVEIKPFTPVYAYFITSYYFSQSAIELCRKSDIIPVDRILLSFTFGLQSDYQDSGTFIKSKLIYYINNIEKIE